MCILEGRTRKEGRVVLARGKKQRFSIGGGTGAKIRVLEPDEEFTERSRWSVFLNGSTCLLRLMAGYWGFAWL